MSLAEHSLRRWQLAFLRAAVASGTEYIAVRGGLGSGKSAGGVYLAEAIATTRPGALIAIVADTGRRVLDIIHPLCQQIFPSAGATYRASDREWHFPNGSIVRLRMYYGAGQVAGQNPLEGATYTAVICEEAQTLPPDILERAFDRARDYRRDIAGGVQPPLVVTIGVPSEPCWWVERARELKTQGVKVAIFLPRSADNAEAYGDGWLERRRAVLGEEQFQALYENKPRPATGNIYDCWVPDDGDGGNLVSGWRLEPGMRVAVVVDPGRNKPAIIAAAKDEALDAWVVFDEWSPTQERPAITVPDASALAEHMLARWWPRRWARCCPRRNVVLVDEVIGDPNAKVRETDSRYYHERLALPPPGALQGKRSHGFGLPVWLNQDPARKSVRAGIARVRSAMQAQRLLMTSELWKRGQSAPAGAHTLARSILGYAYRGDGEPERDKGFDDFCDTVRYLVTRHLWWEDGLEGRAPLHLATTVPRFKQVR